MLATGALLSPFISMSLLLLMPSPPTPIPMRHVKQLTLREVEVWRYISSGLNSREIAEKMGVSSATIDAHKEHLRSKLGVKSWSASRLTLLGIQHGLFTIRVDPALIDISGMPPEDQLVCINAVVFRKQMEAAGIALDLARFKAQSRKRARP